MSNPDPSRKTNSGGAASAVGCALTAIGLLILVPSGLCTMVLLPSVFTAGFARASDLLVVAVIAAAGAALVYAGYKVGTRG